MVFKIGDRVQLHPGTDDWMRGDRFGDVERIIAKRDGRVLYGVRLDKSGRIAMLPADRLERVS